MTIEKKAAGQALQGPQIAPATSDKTALSGEARLHARPAGIAPTFDVQAMQTVERAGRHKGMISNPWVKHWSGQGPVPDMAEVPLADGVAAASDASGEPVSNAVSTTAATKAAASKKAAGEAGVKDQTDAPPS
jgi:hypothetical protein